MRVAVRVLSILLAKSIGVWCATGIYGAWFATKKTQREIENLKTIAGLKVENVNITTKDKFNISAWWVKNTNNPNGKAVMMFSGRGNNRMYNVSRAELYLRQGYSVLLPDLRGSGQSDGNCMTFGWEERKDVLACYDFLVEQDCESIGAHGHSQGAAAVIYACQYLPELEFVVMESCYYSIQSLRKNVLEYSNLPPIMGYSGYFFTQLAMPADLRKMRPCDFIQHCKSPTLLLAGDSEVIVKKHESIDLFQKCGAKFKNLYLFENARHENLLVRNPEVYSKLLTQFIKSVESDETVNAEDASISSSILNYINPSNYFYNDSNAA